jgi:hypothetical protein
LCGVKQSKFAAVKQGNFHFENPGTGSEDATLTDTPRSVPPRGGSHPGCQSRGFQPQVSKSFGCDYGLPRPGSSSSNPAENRVGGIGAKPYHFPLPGGELAIILAAIR